MTKEDAIKGLKTLAKEFSGYKPNEEMFNMAIKALEQEPNEDAISREKALRTMCVNCDDWQTCKMDCQRRKSIEALPPVNLAKKEDAISRQAALDINENHHGQMSNDINHQIWKEINSLPPVNPVKKESAISKQQVIDLIEGMVADATSNGYPPRLAPEYVIDGIKAL